VDPGFRRDDSAAEVLFLMRCTDYCGTVGALILAVFDDDVPRFEVRVAYGTSQRTTTLHRGEFSILRDRNPAAYEAAGLSHDTKFDLKQALDLPYTTEWFTVPAAAPHGQTPKLGTLHPSLVRAVQAAFRAATG
jgi:hypothetical protein